MFAVRYFCSLYFAPRYFFKIGQDSTPSSGFWNSLSGNSGMTGGGDLEDVF